MSKGMTAEEIDNESMERAKQEHIETEEVAIFANNYTVEERLSRIERFLYDHHDMCPYSDLPE